MAIEKTVTLVDRLDESITFDKAYHRITRIDGNKNSISFYVDVFKTKDAEFSLNQTKHSFQPVLNGNNFIAQAYAHLKTLPEFAGATDC